MANRLTINDSWVLERAGYFSNSFSGFLSKIINSLKFSPEIKAELEQIPQVGSPEKLKKMDIPSFVQPLISKTLGILGPDFSKELQKTIETSLKQAYSKTDIAEKRVSPKIEEATEELSKLDQRLSNLEGQIEKRIVSKLFGGDPTSLTQALYDVAKERGIQNEGILHLIRMLPEFEALMYFLNVKKFYRDHTSHSLRVAVLGDYLLDSKSDAGPLEAVLRDKLALSSEEIRTTWWFTGLLHDIGIPLEKLFTSLNWSLINELLRCYSSLDMEVTPLQINLRSKLLDNQAYLAILTEGLPSSWQSLIENGLGSAREPESLIFKPDSKLPQRYEPERTSMDHGVLAAVSLLRTLGPPERLQDKRPEDRPFIEAAKAIALHNLVRDLRTLSFDDYPLLFLLVFADELQEWSRPIPVTTDDSYFTTSLEKIVLLDEIYYEKSKELWDIPYINAKAKELSKFNFKRLCTDKSKALLVLDCAEQFPESDLWLANIEPDKPKASETFNIKIKTH